MAPPTAHPVARPASANKNPKGSSARSPASVGARKPSTPQSNSAKDAKGTAVQKGDTAKAAAAKAATKTSAKAEPKPAKAPSKNESKAGAISSNKAKGSKPELKQSAKSSKPAPKAAESKAATSPKSTATKAAEPPAAPKSAGVKSTATHSSPVLVPKPKGKRKAEKPPPPRKMHQPVISTGPTLVKSPPPSAISRPGPMTMVGPRPASMMPPPAPIPTARANSANGPNGKPNSPAPPPQPNRPPRLSPFAVTAPIMPVQTKPLKLRMGDKAVHPKHGLGEVIAVEERELGGMKGEFYVLRILDNGMRVMVPVSSPSGLRSVMSPKEADGVLDTMRAREVAVDLQPWSRRFRAYTEMIKSGSPHEVAKVLRDMYRLKFDKDLSFGERRLLDQAKSLLMKELAAAKGVTEVALNEQVAKMFQA